MANENPSPPTPFELSVPEHPESLRISSFRAVEEVSGLYRLDVHVLADAPDESLAGGLLDASASLFLLSDGVPVRALHGMIARVEAHGTFLHDRQALRLTIVPKLWKLKRRRTRRIFQDSTTQDIASLLLGEWGVDARFQIDRDLPARGYTVQYDETDYAFLVRLFAEEGLFFFFDHPLVPADAPGEVLVVADSVADYVPIDGDETLRFERIQPESGMSPREDQVTWFISKDRIRSSGALVRGYDFRRPDTELGDDAGATEETDLPTIYEHEGSYEDDLGPRPASIRLEQQRKKAETAEGTTFCRRLIPGRRFTLVDHDFSSLDRPWVVTHIEHEGYAAEVVPQGRSLYQNRFRCASADVVVRPRDRARKPMQVAETAVVVGPSEQEIYTDPFGRIKIQFHWDLEGQDDDRSSCWVRVAQAWAGAGWGAQFIPRVGMEVVVTFLGGDLDRPLVTGAVYNATHPPPFPLPDTQTRSGIRTSSTPDSDGSNELSFEDAAGAEQVYIHAQRNYDEVIDNDQSSRVGGSRSVEVAQNAGERVGLHATLDVGGDRATSIDGNDRLTVGGRWEGTVSGDRALEVRGNSTVTVLQGHTVEVRGDRAIVVGSTGATSQSDHYVYGSASLSASERVVIRADQGIVLQCGDSTIEITPEKIVLRAATVEISPTKALECSTKDGPTVTLGEDIEILAKKFRLFTESGALELDKEFKVKGDKIKLGYDPSAPSVDKADEKPETKPFSCKFSNYFLQPYATKKYHLMVQGLRFEGETDGEGIAKEDIPKSATQVVVRLWIDDYPEGRQRIYTLKIRDFPSVDGVIGAKMRLRNLGYYEGHVDEGQDDELRTAVADFQDDHRDTHGLEPTGELDSGTAGALEEVHGG